MRRACPAPDQKSGLAQPGSSAPRPRNITLHVHMPLSTGHVTARECCPACQHARRHRSCARPYHKMPRHGPGAHTHRLLDMAPVSHAPLVHQLRPCPCSLMHRCEAHSSCNTLLPCARLGTTRRSRTKGSLRRRLQHTCKSDSPSPCGRWAHGAGRAATPGEKSLLLRASCRSAAAVRVFWGPRQGHLVYTRPLTGSCCCGVGRGPGQGRRTNLGPLAGPPRYTHASASLSVSG